MNLTAEQRAMEMMQIPMGRLPWLAVEFAKHLCRRLGGCGEVFITAYACYAQCIEGLPCDDEAYAADGDAQKWFRERHSGDGLLPDAPPAKPTTAGTTTTFTLLPRGSGLCEVADTGQDVCPEPAVVQIETPKCIALRMCRWHFEAWRKDGEPTLDELRALENGATT